MVGRPAHTYSKPVPDATRRIRVCLAWDCMTKIESHGPHHRLCPVHRHEDNPDGMSFAPIPNRVSARREH